MGPQLVFGSLTQSYSQIILTDHSESSHSAYRFAPLNKAHSQNMSKESPPQCDPTMALGNNLFLTKYAPNTIKTGPGDTLLNPQEASETKDNTPAR